MVEGLGTSLGHGEVWAGVPAQCDMECNSWESNSRGVGETSRKDW